MAQNDVEEFLLERMQSPKGLGDVMASVGEGLACHPRGAREDSVFYLLCSFEMFPLHGEQNPQDVRLPPLGSEAGPWGRCQRLPTGEQFLGCRAVATSPGGMQVAGVLVLSPQPDPKPASVPHLQKGDDNENMESDRTAGRPEMIRESAEREAWEPGSA